MRLFHSECVDKHYYISKYQIWLMNVIICKSVKCYSLFNVKIKVNIKIQKITTQVLAKVT